MSGPTRDKTDIVESVARAMHDAYETAAIENSWVTNELCRVPFDELPSENKATMRASARAALAEIERLRTSPGFREAREAAAKLADDGAEDCSIGPSGREAANILREVATAIRALSPSAKPET